MNKLFDKDCVEVWQALSVYYDEISGINEKNFVQAAGIGYGERVVKLLEHYKYQPDGKAILGIGCGTGILMCYLGLLGYRTIGIDISSSMIALANKRKDWLGLTQTSFVCKDARYLNRHDLGVKAGFLYARELINHLSSKEDVSAIINNLSSLMEPAATIVLELFTQHGLSQFAYPLSREYDNFFYEQSGAFDAQTGSGFIDYAFVSKATQHRDATHLPIFFWDQENLYDMFDRAGLKSIEFFDNKVEASYTSCGTTINLAPVSAASELYLAIAQK